MSVALTTETYRLLSFRTTPFYLGSGKEKRSPLLSFLHFPQCSFQKIYTAAGKIGRMQVGVDCRNAFVHGEHIQLTFSMCSTSFFLLVGVTKLCETLNWFKVSRRICCTSSLMRFARLEASLFNTAMHRWIFFVQGLHKEHYGLMCTLQWWKYKRYHLYVYRELIYKQ